MSTIDELINICFIDGKFIQDGTFKVTRPPWHEDAYFLPNFKCTSDRRWHGLNSLGTYDWHKKPIDFEIYKEPKKKVKHWLWYDSSRSFPISLCLYPEGHFDKGWKKIPGSEVEV